MWALFPGLVAIFGSAYLLFLRKRERKSIELPPNVSRDKQSLPVKGEPGVYKCGLLTNDNMNIVDSFFPKVKTLYDGFIRGMEEGNDGPCVGSRGTDGKYHFKKYSEIYSDAKNFASTLVGEFGLNPSNNTFVGIYSQNCPEWLITALACIQQSIVIVPLYDTLGADAATFIVSQTEMSTIVVDTVEKMRKLISRKTEMPTLQRIIVINFDSLTELDIKNIETFDIEVISFNDVLLKGIGKVKHMHLPTADDTYIICYTSGTTGTPKGVIITHANIVSNLSAWLYLLHKFMPDVLNHNQVHISYLPLSHMMEQMSHWTILFFGARIGYFRGSIQGLTDDIQELKPTVFPVVPRLLNRLYDAIQVKVQNAGFIGRMLFNIAYTKKLVLLKKGIVTKDTIWDKLVFGKIQAQLGGAVHTMATGSAPISAEVLETCRLALGATIFEAYGQTECSAMASITWPGDWISGHCGGPAPCTNIRLADIPELNYYAKDGKGEVMVRGPSVTKGYFKDLEKTATLFDKDGFLHTGDVGEMLPNGAIRIIDRKKHIFKLAQGEYVAPEKIENVYIRSPIVQQIYVDGDSLQRWLIAVVVPWSNILEEWNNEHGTAGRCIQDLCMDEKVHDFVLSELHKIGKENKLNSIEQVKRVVLTTEVFSVENGLLTPTLKAKRPQLRLKYKDIMSSIYEQYKNL